MALKTYCKQLISSYDRYGASRSENSDGARHHTRIGADIDCREGDPAEGVADMEELLRNKRFQIPPPPTAREARPQVADMRTSAFRSVALPVSDPVQSGLRNQSSGDEPVT